MDDPIAQVERNKQTLEALIVWMAQSAASPISHAEAVKLCEMLNEPKSEQESK